MEEAHQIGEDLGSASGGTPWPRFTTWPAAPAAAGLHLPGTVTDVAYRGVDLLVTVAAIDASGARVRLVSDVRATGTSSLAPGDDVVVTAPQSRLVALAD